MLFCENFLLTLKETKATKILVAFSGGLDSRVLLELVAKQLSNFSIQVLHVNHNLQKNANDWQHTCAAICQALNLSFQAILVEVDQSSGQSLEAAARAARYTALEKWVDSKTVLLTAHHQEDQAETVLLQLLRGAGPKGLSAMPFFKRFSLGWHARPFLMMSKKILQNYAHSENLQFIEDPSNACQDFDRNYLRHSVMPLLKSRWSASTKAITRAALHCAQEIHLLDEFAAVDLASVLILDALDLQKLQQFSMARQANVLRYWLQQLQIPLPSTKKIQEILQVMQTAKLDKNPCIKWSCYEARRYRQRLYVMPKLKPIDLPKEIIWRVAEDLNLGELGWLRQSDLPPFLLSSDLKFVTICFNPGGSSIKKKFQAWGIAPWLRDRTPLLLIKGLYVAALKWTVPETSDTID